MKASQINIANFYLKNNGGWGTIVGKCMQPQLLDGWRVKVSPCTKDDVNIGDIIVVGSKNIMCHRLVSKISLFHKIYFVHKGDNSFQWAICDSKWLIGKAVEIVTAAGDKVDCEALCQEKVRYSVIAFRWGVSIYLLKKIINRIKYIFCKVNIG